MDGGKIGVVGTGDGLIDENGHSHTAPPLLHLPVLSGSSQSRAS